MSSISPERYREVLGHLPTGVAVITAYGEHGPAGMAVNSVTSVSLEPPKVPVCPANPSTTWPTIRVSGALVVNVMAGDHESVCRRFALRDGERFSAVATHDRLAGPALDAGVACIECDIDPEYEVGDHTIVVANVIELDAARSVPPLVFFRGQ